LTSATISSANGGTATVRYRDVVREITLAAGQAYAWGAE
jgi:hypothetical protein